MEHDLISHLFLSLSLSVSLRGVKRETLDLLLILELLLLTLLHYSKFACCTLSLAGSSTLPLSSCFFLPRCCTTANTHFGGRTAYLIPKRERERKRAWEWAVAEVCRLWWSSNRHTVIFLFFMGTIWSKWNCHQVESLVYYWICRFLFYWAKYKVPSDDGSWLWCIDLCDASPRFNFAGRKEMGKEISRWYEWLIRSCIDIPWQQRRKVTVGFWENYD